MADSKEWEDWFERVWEKREQELYPSLFGKESVGIFPIPFDRLTAAGSTDPRWNTCGVFRFSPTAERPSWLFVSSGLSNAWFDDAPDPTGISGFGCEFVLETDSDAEWPIHRLHQLMAIQIATLCGKIEDATPLGYLDRIPANSPIDWETSELNIVMLAPPRSAPSEFHQETGRASFLGIAAVTEDEAEFARSSGGDVLLEMLVAADAYPVIRPTRSSVLRTA